MSEKTQTKNFQFSMAVPHYLQSGFLAKGHMPRVSRQSAKDKSDNETILGDLHRSHLTGEENPGKSDVGILISKSRP